MLSLHAFRASTFAKRIRAHVCWLVLLKGLLRYCVRSGLEPIRPVDRAAATDQRDAKTARSQRRAYIFKRRHV